VRGEERRKVVVVLFGSSTLFSYCGKSLSSCSFEDSSSDGANMFVSETLIMNQNAVGITRKHLVSYLGFTHAADLLSCHDNALKGVRKKKKHVSLASPSRVIVMI